MTHTTWKHRLLSVAVVLLLCGVLGGLVMVSGIVPVKASSGHWQVTRWILNFAKSRSVATHSLGIDVPALGDASLVLRGAGHYETGCVQCHGSPARPASPIALGMTAAPPALPPRIAMREPQELFSIVKHGIKFTGMPAWPAQQRDDEVWALVAFLLHLPSMDESEYLELTAVDAEGAQMLRELQDVPVSLLTCVRCHGRDGGGRGAFPKLAGQSRTYLSATLKAYADGKRHSGMMQPVAAILSDDEISALAQYFASLPGEPSSSRGDSQDTIAEAAQEDHKPAGDIERGKAIADGGIPERNVPSCVDCHGPRETPLAETYPGLSGQDVDYLMLQLRLFQSGRRGGTASAHLMEPAVSGLAEQDIHDIAAYYGSLPMPLLSPVGTE